MDGQLKSFISILNKTKSKIKKRKYIKITEKVSLEKDGKRFQLNQVTFEVDYKLNFENKIIATKKFS